MKHNRYSYKPRYQARGIASGSLTPLERERRARRVQRHCTSAFTMIEVMIVICLFGVLLNIAAPNVIRARNRAAAHACGANLRRIRFAKEAYMLENNKPITVSAAELTDERLFGDNGYLKTKPVCPDGGHYTTGAGYEDPLCDFGGGNIHRVDLP